MKDRIRQVRKALRLNQTEFGAKLGATQAMITSYETGRVEPTPAMLQSICFQYGVNLQWLQTGQGSMFSDDEDDRIIDAALPAEDEFIRSVIRSIVKLPNGWERFRTAVYAIQAELDKNKPDA